MLTLSWSKTQADVERLLKMEENALPKPWITA